MHKQSFSELRRAYANRDCTPLDVVRSALAHAKAANEQLNAFAWLDEISALSSAQASTERWQKGCPLSPIDGMPITVKDSAAVQGWPTRRGSLCTPDTAAPADAVFVARLRAAGAVLLGKTRAPEFNWKGVTDSPGFGVTRNPLDPRLTPGGSSGGCSAAVAAGVVRMSLGSDAAGSVRIPASFTGILGLKPTRGRIPIVPFPTHFSSLAHLGPLAASTADLADVLSVVSGTASGDWTSALGNARPVGSNTVEPQELKVGIVADSALGDMHEQVRHGMRTMAATLSDNRITCTTVELDIRTASNAAADLYRLGCAQALTHLDERSRQRIDPGLLAYVQKTHTMTLSEYMHALTIRDHFAAELAALYENVDVLMLPTVPILPFEAGRNTPPGRPDDDWLSWNPYTPAFNLLPDPVLNYPVQTPAGQLPVGMQFAAPPLEEQRLLSLASFLDRLNRDAA